MKRIIAHAFGSLSKKTRRKLLRLFSGFRVAFWCTDGYRAYNDELQKATTNFKKQNTLLANCIQSVLSVKISALPNRLKRLNRKTVRRCSIQTL
ncbi:MAG: IS1 family transposase [Symbiopectobacterium sp.]